MKTPRDLFVRHGPWERTRAALERALRTDEALSEWAALPMAEAAGRFSDPNALLAFLDDPGTPAAGRNAVLRELLRWVQAPTPSSLPSGMLLLALWPGMSAVRRRWRLHYRGREGELVSDVTATVLLRARRLELDNVTWIAATLCRASERELATAYRAARRTEPWAEDQHGCSGTTSEHVDFVDLQRWLQEHAPADAELLLRVAHGEAVGDVARKLGLSPNAASQRLKRVRDRLRPALEAERRRAAQSQPEAA